MRKIGLSLLIVLALVTGAWVLSKSTRFQLFGELVPRVDTDEPVVALTFDDGPTPGKTDAILATLAAQEVRATFFLVGEAMQRHPDETRRIVAAGHEVGNHSFTHSRMLLKSPRFVAAEIESTDALIRQAGFAGPIRFRPPYGKRLLILPWYLSRHDITTVTWDSAPESELGSGASAEEIAAQVERNARPGSIILMHVMFDARAESMKAVPQVIERLRQNGYRFVTVSELMNMGVP